MGEFNRKKALYDRIDQIRRELGISDNCYPLDMVTICMEKGLATVEDVPFKSPLTKGMAVPSYESGKKDIILLNFSLSKRELSFACGHEVIHLTIHRCKVIRFFSFEQVMRKQNPYLEWQANVRLRRAPYTVSATVSKIESRFSVSGIATGHSELKSQSGE